MSRDKKRADGLTAWTYTPVNTAKNTKLTLRGSLVGILLHATEQGITGSRLFLHVIQS